MKLHSEKVRSEKVNRVDEWFWRIEKERVVKRHSLDFWSFPRSIRSFKPIPFYRSCCTVRYRNRDTIEARTYEIIAINIGGCAQWIRVGGRSYINEIKAREKKIGNKKYIIAKYCSDTSLLRYENIAQKRNARNFCFSMIDALMHCTELIRILY